MASLTESFLISELLRNVNNDNWYDRVYLCIEKDTTNTQIINGFNCYSFRNFDDANAYIDKNKNKIKNIHDKRFTTIPMCKWVPCMFHKNILNNKLHELYWNKNITLFRQPISSSFGKG
jgi:hypothetical protein